MALNSEIATEAGSPQEQWLRADLAANPTLCTLAFWHRPRWSSGHHLSGAGQGLYQALYDYGADVLLSGHDHDYERFSPQDPAGQYAPDRGIRQFVVGTGGDALRSFEFIQPNSEVRNSDTWGVIKMTLHEGSYDWEFVPIPGQTWTDSGTANCVTAPGVPTAPVVTSPTVEPAVAVNPVADSADTGDFTLVSSGATPTLASVPAGGASYTVKAGDTLSIIGAQYGLSWTAIAAANGLTEASILQIDQVLRLPGVDDVNQTASSPSTVSAPPVTTTTPSTHTVQAGDTLFGLAVKYGVTRTALAAANGITETGALKAGQVLSIPGQTTASYRLRLPWRFRLLRRLRPAQPRPTTPATAKLYTVQEGDTIITIALDNNLDWQELLELNGLQPDSLLQIGQQIKLQ
ncbi:MAG: LysM peptidoglycan-binding domain-containing protein [Anaerolineales bacterium]|nr:LysM peptidoglycan-binding domain-containing protein [Anaerolineales bacterium]